MVLHTGQLVYIKSHITGLEQKHSQLRSWITILQKLSQNINTHFRKLDDYKLCFKSESESDTGDLVLDMYKEWITDAALVGIDDVLVHDIALKLPHTRRSVDVQLTTRDGVVIDGVYEFAYQDIDANEPVCMKEVEKAFGKNFSVWVTRIQTGNYNRISNSEGKIEPHIPPFTPVDDNREYKALMLDRAIIKPNNEEIRQRFIKYFTSETKSKPSMGLASWCLGGQSSKLVMSLATKQAFKETLRGLQQGEVRVGEAAFDCYDTTKGFYAVVLGTAVAGIWAFVLINGFEYVHSPDLYVVAGVTVLGGLPAGLVVLGYICRE